MRHVCWIRWNTRRPHQQPDTGADSIAGTGILTEANIRQLKAARKFIARKQRQYDIQNREFPDMQPDPKPAEYLDNATFVNKDYETCQFTHLQNMTSILSCKRGTPFLTGNKVPARPPPHTTGPNTCLNSAKCAMSSYWLPPSPST